ERACRANGTSIRTLEIPPQDGREQLRWEKANERKRRARQAALDRRPSVEGHAVDETQRRHAVAMADGDRLCDTAAHAVAHDARARNSELIEDADDAFRVRANVDGAGERTITSAVAEQVEHDDAMARRRERDDVAPEMTRRRKAVEKHDRIAGAARSGRIV